METLIGFVIGLAAGAAAAALLTRSRAGLVAERLAARDAESARLTLEVTELKQSLAAARAETTHALECRAAADRSVARLEAELAAERAAAAEKLGLLAQAQEQLAHHFRSLSAQALATNNQAFIELATQTLGRFQKGAEGELEKRQQAIGELVGPVKETLSKLDGRLSDIEKTREGAYQALTAQVRSLSDTQGELRRETANLVKALRQPAARGRWGELQLRRVVEMAGMLEYCDFLEQVTVTCEKGGDKDGEESRLRPDIVVRLPGGRNIVVDAKAPLAAYLEAIETDDEDAKRAKLADHARQVRDHIARLGRKSYQEQFEPTPDLVVLFLPGEMFFSAALQHDPELIELGVNEKVIPATPTTLIALLRAVHYGWKQEALARNAQEICDLGRELFERLATLGRHWNSVGKNLGDAVAAYNRSVASMETRVLVSARRFRSLEAVGDKEIETLSPVELLPRALQAPELADVA